MAACLRSPLQFAPSFWAAATVVLSLGLTPGCRKTSPDGDREAVVAPDPAALRAFLTHYADLGFAVYTDSAHAVRALEIAVTAFVNDPTEESLAAARAAWTQSRVPYQQSEVFRFYDGPIDQVEILVNPWPIDENYVEGSSPGTMGIVDDVARYPELSAALLANLNVKDGETSVTTGFHVIEFLLWGRDARADGPGDRPHTDFEVTEREPKSERSIRAARRGRYLVLATKLLAEQLEGVRDAWAPIAPGNYRTRFLALPPREALALVVKGMGSLSGPELAGERLSVAYATKAQENEHSCFSDNTHQDTVYDAIGIRNVCTGRYERPDGRVLQGPGLCDTLARRTPDLAHRLRADIAASVAATRAIPAPFDRAILGNDATPGRRAVLAAIRALERQTDTLARVAARYDIRLVLARPSTLR